MKNIVGWLLEIEHLALEMYESVADYFIDDRKLHDFLKHMAKDEAYRYQVVDSAANYFQQHHFPNSPVILDDEIKNKIRDLLKTNLDKILDKSLIKEQLINNIVEAELSEWNDFFLFMVNTLKHEEKQFEYAASEFQHHIKHLEYFIKNESGFSEQIELLQNLNPVHKEKILVVEDNEDFAELLKRTLSKKGSVDLAANGQEGLKKIAKTFYKLIVSDIDMPIMDGLTFYKKTISKYPNLTDLFVFLSGDLSPARLSFFKDNKLKYLTKPASVKEIRQITSKVMYQSNHGA